MYLIRCGFETGTLSYDELHTHLRKALERAHSYSRCPSGLSPLSFVAINSFFAGRLSPCRFVPSCSSYALEALEVHGALRGSWLTLRRLLRCRPFGPHGVDLVPESPLTRSPRSCTR